MTLRQSQFVPPVPLIVARERGFLTGIDLDTRRTTGSPEQLSGLLTGDIDIAVTAIDNLFEWIRQGARVSLVAQVEATTPLGVYARAETLGDLSGRRFGVDAAANGFALAARHVLRDAGVEVSWIEVGGVAERLDALLAGDVDATLLGPPFDERATSAGAHEVASIPALLPGWPGQGLVVRRDIAESADVTAYVRALDAAVAEATALTDADGEALLARSGFGAAAASAWATRPRTLDVDPAGLALLTGIREGLGLLPDGIRLTDLHDPGPLRRARGH